VDVPDFWIVHVYVSIPTRGKSVEDGVALGSDLLALFDAADGGRLSRSTAEALVDSGRARLLIGQAEGLWLDCKEQPYANSEHGHDELAKDVSAFANSPGGGLILVGLRTRKHLGRDTVTAVAPVPSDHRRADRYRKLVARRVHPRVIGLAVREVQYSTGALMIISVPPQPPALQPFMVRGAFRGGKLVGSHMAIYYRDDDLAAVATVEEIHALVVAGRAALASAASEGFAPQ
jgi:Putative DNA-binding domain